MWTEAQEKQIFTNDTDKILIKRCAVGTVPNNKLGKQHIKFLRLFHTIKLYGRTPKCRCNNNHKSRVPIKCAKNIAVYLHVKPSILDKISTKLIGIEEIKGRCNCKCVIPQIWCTCKCHLY